MIFFFENAKNTVYAVKSEQTLTPENIDKLNWLFGESNQITKESIDGFLVGPRAAMITPWSTNAVEITQNMGIRGIVRIEEFHPVSEDFIDFDPMLSQKYAFLNQNIFDVKTQPAEILEIENIALYNQAEGL